MAPHAQRRLLSLRRLPPVLLAAAACATLGACDRLDHLLSVDPQDVIPATPFEQSPANAQLLANGAISDFDCAFGAYVVTGGLIGEELDETRENTARRPYDQRTHTSKDQQYAVNGCAGLGVYTPLQVARASAERAYWLLGTWTDAEVPNRQLLQASMAAYAGYSTLLLAEGFCTTVISSLDENGQLIFGGEISPDSAFRVAIARFDQAIAAADAAGTNGNAIRSFALVGRARARLFLEDFGGARADALLVPSSFSQVMTASAASLRRQNRVWAQNNGPSPAVSVGILYRTMNDPRVSVTDLGRRSVTGVPFVLQNKYPSAAAPIRIASGAEAQLMIAEADIQAGTATSLQNAQTIINVFRARGSQAALTTTDPEVLHAALIDQRRRELFLEGQHLGDVIRFGIDLTPPPGTVFPAGGFYGSQVCLPLPDVERENNPVLGG